jgi:hypothetical protein
MATAFICRLELSSGTHDNRRYVKSGSVIPLPCESELEISFPPARDGVS